MNREVPLNINKKQL